MEEIEWYEPKIISNIIDRYNGTVREEVIIFINFYLIFS